MPRTAERERRENPLPHEALIEVLEEDPNLGLVIADVLYGQKRAKVPPKEILAVIEALKKAEVAARRVAAEAIASVREQLK